MSQLGQAEKAVTARDEFRKLWGPGTGRFISMDTGPSKTMSGAG